MQVVIFGCGNIGFDTVMNLIKDSSIEKVYIFDRSYPEHLRGYLERNPAESKVISFFEIDAENENSVQKAFSSVIKGKIDILICTTGVYSSVPVLKNFNQFKSDYDSNLFSILIPIKNAVNGKIFNIGARILVMCSTSGHHAPKNLTSYAPSKWALGNLMSSLRSELKPQNIEIDIISPTTIRNKYSKVFNFTAGIETLEVVNVIRKIITKMNEGKKFKGKNHFVPWYYFLVRFIERIFPEYLNFRAGLKFKYKRRRIYKKYVIQSALITGAASGLGKELANLYSKSLKNIYLISKNQEGLNEVKAHIESVSDCSVSIYRLDLSNLQEVASLADTLPSIDLLINCAGVHIRSSVCDAPIDIYKKIFAVNFFSSVMLISKFLKNQSPPKKIINILSTTAIAGRKNLGIYSSPKASLWSFTRSLRRVYGNKMQIVEVIPSTFISNLFEKGIRLDGSTISRLDPSKYQNSYDIAKLIHAKEKEGEDIIFSSFKVKLFLWLNLFFPVIFDRKFP